MYFCVCKSAECGYSLRFLFTKCFGCSCCMKGNSLELRLYFQAAFAALPSLEGARASCQPFLMFSGRQSCRSTRGEDLMYSWTLTSVQTDKSKKGNKIYSRLACLQVKKLYNPAKSSTVKPYPGGNIHSCLFIVFQTTLHSLHQTSDSMLGILL